MFGQPGTMKPSLCTTRKAVDGLLHSEEDGTEWASIGSKLHTILKPELLNNFGVADPVNAVPWVTSTPFK